MKATHFHHSLWKPMISIQNVIFYTLLIKICILYKINVLCGKYMICINIFKTQLKQKCQNKWSMQSLHIFAKLWHLMPFPSFNRSFGFVQVRSSVRSSSFRFVQAFVQVRSNSFSYCLVACLPFLWKYPKTCVHHLYAKAWCLFARNIFCIYKLKCVI